MALIGPFFYINNTLYANKCSLDVAEARADKLDNPYGHDRLYDDHFKEGDYIDYPRGRVVWDCTKKEAIIYIDPCINKIEIVDRILEEFELKDYVLGEDLHYHCKNCVGDIWKM